MNRHERQTIKSYGKIADTYDDSFEGRFTLPFQRKLIEAIDLQDGGRLLDVACGNGRFLKMLRQGRTFEGYGADITKEMVEAASRCNPGMTFKTAPCDKLPFDDGLFDVVTVCAAFHHFPDINAFAKEAKRVIAPGGRLYIAEIYHSRLSRLLFNPFIRFHPSGDVKLYSPDEIITLLKKNGFDCELPLIDGNIMIITGHSAAEKKEAI